MDIFKVPQREVEVRLLLESGEELEGHFYVPTIGPSGGPGRISGRLNDGQEHFLPLVCVASALLISKTSIMTVLLPSGEENFESREDDRINQHAVELNLKGGLKLTGRLSYSMPPEKRRILDYLNSAPQFMPLLLEDRILLVNRRYLVSIRDLEKAG